MDKKLYKSKLTTIFHRDIFFELMEFWKIVEEQEYDYKIFVSKKAFVLYKVCKPLFYFNNYKECTKITDTAIPMYLEQMKNKSVLVIDDVFIHGRAVARIQNLLSKNVKKLDFYTFAKNNMHQNLQDMDTCKTAQAITHSAHFKEKLNFASMTIQENRVKGYLKCNEYQWKRISDLIMKSLWGVNMPYTSYLPIFNMYEIDRVSNLAVTKQKDVYKEYSSASQTLLGQKFAYYIERSMCNNVHIHYCYVISRNSFTQNCKIMPMVFFDCENTSIDKDFILNSIEFIYESKAQELVSYFIRDRKLGYELASLLKFLTFSVGYLSTKRFLMNNGIREQEYFVEFENAEYSFGQEIKEYIEILEMVDVTRTLERIERCVISSFADEKRKKIDMAERELLLEGLEEACNEMRNCSVEKDFPEIVNVLSRYFKFNNRFRESIIFKCKPTGERYVTGLRFSDIKEYLEGENFSTEEIIFGLMCRYNQGAATIDFLSDLDINRQLVGLNMYWRAGEQSYKCISQTYVLIVYFQNIYEKRFNSEVSQFLYDRLLEVAIENYSQYSIPFSRHDFEKYSNKRDNVYNAFDIERYCMQKEYRYLGYIAKQMEQYVLRGHIEEIRNKDIEGFKANLLEFMEYHTDENTMLECRKILWNEKEQ